MSGCLPGLNSGAANGNQDLFTHDEQLAFLRKTVKIPQNQFFGHTVIMKKRLIAIFTQLFELNQTGFIKI